MLAPLVAQVKSSQWMNDTAGPSGSPRSQVATFVRSSSICASFDYASALSQTRLCSVVSIETVQNGPIRTTVARFVRQITRASGNDLDKGVVPSQSKAVEPRRAPCRQLPLFENETRRTGSTERNHVT
jgi:hypothetical protein